MPVVARDDGKRVVWPHYFDKKLTRRQGRRVPADLAVDDPRPGDIANACRTLGLKPELDEDARPPAFWYERKGRVVIVASGEPKETVLKNIARRL